jgi:hypothetical protein
MRQTGNGFVKYEDTNTDPEGRHRLFAKGERKAPNLV